MAELAEAQTEIGRLHDMFRQQRIEIDRLTALGNRPVNVNVEAISDLLPDSFSGTQEGVEVEDFFKNFESWQYTKTWSFQTLFKWTSFDLVDKFVRCSKSTSYSARHAGSFLCEI